LLHSCKVSKPDILDFCFGVPVGIYHHDIFDLTEDVDMINDDTFDLTLDEEGEEGLLLSKSFDPD